MIDDLDEKVASHQSGAGSTKVAIREGIFPESIQKDAERNGPPVIPANFTNLNNIRTEKTSIRKPRDYPILASRFE
jgi:hypothetical protein